MQPSLFGGSSCGLGGYTKINGTQFHSSRKRQYITIQEDLNVVEIRPQSS